jgi:hypothetical protein
VAIAWRGRRRIRNKERLPAWSLDTDKPGAGYNRRVRSLKPNAFSPAPRSVSLIAVSISQTFCSPSFSSVALPYIFSSSAHPLLCYLSSYSALQCMAPHTPHSLIRVTQAPSTPSSLSNPLLIRPPEAGTIEKTASHRRRVVSEILSIFRPASSKANTSEQSLLNFRRLILVGSSSLYRASAS